MENGQPQSVPVLRCRPQRDMYNETMNARIVVVEDELELAKILRDYLEAAGFDVRIATDGASGLALAEQSPADLVILDLNLPGMDGLDVARQLRRHSETPIIMVTALTEFGDIERAVDCGTDDFLSKPVNRWELIARVRTMLKLKHLSDKLDRTLAYLEQLEKETQPKG